MESGLQKGKSPIPGSDFLTGIVLSALIFLTATFIPLIGSVTILFTPLPILYYYERFGRMRGLAVLVVTLAIVLLALHLVEAEENFFLFLSTGLVGVLLAECFRKGYPIEKTILYPVGLLLAAGGVFLLFLSVSQHEAPLQMIRIYVQKNLQENIRLYSELDFPAEQMGLIKDRVPELTTFFTGIFPAFTTLLAAFVVWLNVLVGRMLLQAQRMPCPEFGDLSVWKAPERLIWILIAAGGSLLLPVAWLKWAGLNVLLICLFCYFMQGLAIASFVFRRRSIPRLFRMLFYFLVFAQFYMILLLTMVGLFDLWFNFRKFVKLKNET